MNPVKCVLDNIYIEMGICSSHKIYPIDKKDTKKIQKSVKIIKNESLYLSKYFTHTFFQNIHRYSNVYRDRHKWKTKILIFETTIQIIMIQDTRKRNIYIKRLKSVFTNNCIDECAYSTIQFSLQQLLQQSLGGAYNNEIIESWVICCEEICKIIKLL